jgi:hypothetical protein
VKIESTGKTGNGGKAQPVEFESFTVVHVQPEDIDPGDRMKAFVAKFGHLVGLTHDNLDELPGAVAARYSAPHPGGTPPGPVG